MAITGIVLGVTAIGLFILLWIWIAFEIHRAPTCDKDGNIISNSRQPNDFRDEKEDVK